MKTRESEKIQNQKLSKADIEKIETLLELCGDRAPIVKKIIIDSFVHLVKQQFVIDETEWKTTKFNDSSAINFLTALNGSSKDWDSVKIFGIPAIVFFRQINLKEHCNETTRGGSKYLKELIKTQGNYCTLCGSKKNLTVDHIDPVNNAGDKNSDSLKNFQILCKRCNEAKNNYANDLIPAVFTTRKTDTIPEQLRIKVLIDNATIENNRLLGRCVCGATANNSELLVKIKIPRSAANYSNLTIACKNCTNNHRVDLKNDK